MNRFLLFIVALAVAFSMFCCQNRNHDTNEIANIFKPLVEEEIQYIIKNIEGLEKDKGKVWYKGDSIFFSNWLKGAQEELDGNYNNAISFYNKALTTKRYEISSYEIKLPLGRVYLQINDKPTSKKMLLEFKQEAKRDLTGEEVEWGLTDEAKESLSRDIEDCDYLLGMVDAQ